MKQNKDEPIEIYHRVNHLKLKAGGKLTDGPGHLTASNIKEAEKIIEAMAPLSSPEIERMLTEITTIWVKAKAIEDTDKRRKQAQSLSHIANQIKDIASTYHFDLMAHFAASLRDYIMDTALQKLEQLIIVQAHIDAMNTSFRENIKNDDGGLQAEELKEAVRQAIEEHK